MGTVEVYNFLDGKNLCNIFANLIVNKINESFPDARTEITVVNVRNFFIIKGQTTSEVLINISELFQEYLNKYNEELSKKIRVFDMVLYGISVPVLPLTIYHEEIKKITQRTNQLQKYINEFAKNKIYFNIKVDDDSNLVYFDCSDDQYNEVKNILLKKFDGYEYVKYDFSNEVYVSDKLYGLTNHNEKPYILLLNHITDHLFKLGISKEVKMSINTSINTSDLNNESINLKLENNNHIVKKEWLESLIMDVFPFELEVLKTKFSDCNNLIPLLENCDYDTYSLYDLSTRHDMILI